MGNKMKNPEKIFVRIVVVDNVHKTEQSQRTACKNV
jgi:hypothetical protein